MWEVRPICCCSMWVILFPLGLVIFQAKWVTAHLKRTAAWIFIAFLALCYDLDRFKLRHMVGRKNIVFCIVMVTRPHFRQNAPNFERFRSVFCSTFVKIFLTQMLFYCISPKTEHPIPPSTPEDCQCSLERPSFLLISFMLFWPFAELALQSSAGRSFSMSAANQRHVRSRWPIGGESVHCGA